MTINPYITYLVDPVSGCWIWQRAKSKAGYGQVRIKKKLHYTHRLFFELHIGPIPKGDCVLHRCDTPACVNPDHLWLGTKGDNYRDMMMKNRNQVIGKSGEDHAMAKLSPEKAKAIRADKRTCKLIARDYGVSISLISLVKRGGVWP